MTTWTEILTGQIDTDSPVTQPLLTALRDNVRAASEGATDGPVVAAGWHPYDIVDVGDGSDGLLYDFSVDGATFSVTSPTLEDGYEYAFYVENFAPSSVVSGTFRVEASTDGSTYATLGLTTPTATDGFYGFIHLIMPRLSSRILQSRGLLRNGTDVLTSGSEFIATAAPIQLWRIRFTDFTANAGKVYMLRRREYFSG